MWFKNPSLWKFSIFRVSMNWTRESQVWCSWREVYWVKNSSHSTQSCGSLSCGRAKSLRTAFLRFFLEKQESWTLLHVSTYTHKLLPEKSPFFDLGASVSQIKHNWPAVNSCHSLPLPFWRREMNLKLSVVFMSGRTDGQDLKPTGGTVSNVHLSKDFHIQVGWSPKPLKTQRKPMSGAS